MKKRAYYDISEPEYFDETKDYRGGTLVIYSSKKRQKIIKPKYGFKFVQTDNLNRRKS